MTQTALRGLTIPIMLVASAVAFAEDFVPNLARLGGTEIKDGDLGIVYVGPMIVRDGNDPKSPSFALATIKTPQHDTRLLFLMVLNDNGKQITGAGWGGASSVQEGDIKHATTAIIHKTKKIRFAFAYKAMNDAPESFAINDKLLTDRMPRVFIVDLSGNEPHLTGLDVALPKRVPDFTSNNPKQLGKEWIKMIEELKRSSPEISKFMNEYATN